jgi:hypothetical protein
MTTRKLIEGETHRVTCRFAALLFSSVWPVAAGAELPNQIESILGMKFVQIPSG